jgi:hypothetical protein
MPGNLLESRRRGLRYGAVIGLLTGFFLSGLLLSLIGPAALIDALNSPWIPRYWGIWFVGLVLLVSNFIGAYGRTHHPRATPANTPVRSDPARCDEA